MTNTTDALDRALGEIARDRRLQFVPATPAHAQQLAARLAADNAERLTQASGQSPADFLTHAISVPGRHWAVLDLQGVPLALFGIGGDGEGARFLWLTLAADRRLAAVRFGRAVRAVVAAIADAYPRLAAFGDPSSLLQRRWYAWAGFTDIGVQPHLTPGVPPRRLFGICRSAA